MSRRPQVGHLGSNFSLGGEQAEADPLLDRAFYESDDYQAVKSRDDQRCFLIARTGAGKSAILQHLQEVGAGHVVRINPEDLSLPYITDLGVIRFLAALDVHLDPLFIALWKHIFLVELIRHRYKVDSPEAKQNFMGVLIERIKRDPTKRAALDYLEQFEGKFWCEADERVRDITQQFERRIDAEAKARFGIAHVGEASAEGSIASTMSAEVRAEQVERFQRIVNETQLARLNKMIRVLDEDILDSRQHFTYLVIDDLDRDWVDERLVNDLIRCLFRAALDLQRVHNLKVLVALRTNIFEQLDFGHRSGGQEEKFRALVFLLRWRKQELTALLDARAKAAAEQNHIDGVLSIKDILPGGTKARGQPLDRIFARTLMRPRDAIAYLNEALVSGRGKSRLEWRDIDDAELPYSHNRLLALRDEWKLSYPHIDRVLGGFRGAKLPMTKSELADRLEEIVLVLLGGGQNFEGSRWLTQLAEPIWDARAIEGAWVELYQPLVAFLYGIGFIGCSKAPGAQQVYSYDDPEYANIASNLEGSTVFYIHPAFRASLESKGS